MKGNRGYINDLRQWKETINIICDEMNNPDRTKSSLLLVLTLTSLWAFFIELSLKHLLLVNNQKFKKIHNLFYLFSLIDRNSKNKIINNVINLYKNINNSEEFYENLNLCKNSFITSRYSNDYTNDYDYVFLDALYISMLIELKLTSDNEDCSCESLVEIANMHF